MEVWDLPERPRSAVVLEGGEIIEICQEGRAGVPGAHTGVHLLLQVGAGKAGSGHELEVRGSETALFEEGKQPVAHVLVPGVVNLAVVVKVVHKALVVVKLVLRSSSK